MSGAGILALREAVGGLLKALNGAEDSVPLNEEFAFYPVFSAELKNIIGNFVPLAITKKEGTNFWVFRDFMRDMLHCSLF